MRPQAIPFVPPEDFNESEKRQKLEAEGRLWAWDFEEDHLVELEVDDPDGDLQFAGQLHLTYDEMDALVKWWGDN